jgi:hypothetical protein
MSHRFVSTGILAAGIAAVTLAPAAGQAPTATAKTTAKASSWTLPRTAWGQPDLQGIWDFATITPLERPKELAGKEVLTEEEAAEQEEQAAQRRVDRAPRAGDTGSYNQFWFDRGTKVIGTRRSSLVVDPPDGRIPPLTPEARKKAEARAAVTRRPAAGPEDLDLATRCILGFNAGPPMAPNAYNNNVQLFQAPGYVVIFNEMINDSRVVPMDGRPHLAASIRQWRGDSRGRWEGNTLVVDTTNFRDQTNFRGATATLHVVERFTRVAADTLLYEFTVEDPMTWTRPWSAAIPMAKTEGPMFEYACHEGNYGMFDILTGARVEEKAAAQAAKKGSK